jgi:hypothetical protein
VNILPWGKNRPKCKPFPPNRRQAATNHFIEQTKNTLAQPPDLSTAFHSRIAIEAVENFLKNALTERKKYAIMLLSSKLSPDFPQVLHILHKDFIEQTPFFLRTEHLTDSAICAIIKTETQQRRQRRRTGSRAR